MGNELQSKAQLRPQFAAAKLETAVYTRTRHLGTDVGHGGIQRMCTLEKQAEGIIAMRIAGIIERACGGGKLAQLVEGRQ